MSTVQESEQRTGALARIQARLALFASDGEQQSIGEQQALLDARDLVDAVPDLDDDADAALALGLLYWLRSQLLPAERIDAETREIRQMAGGGAARPDADPRRLREALGRTSGEYVGLFLARAAIAVLERSGQTGDVNGLREAAGFLRWALAVLPPDYPEYAWYLSNLAGALGALYEASGDPRVLEEAVTAGLRAAEITPEDHQNYGTYLYTLGGVLQRYYELTGDLGVLLEAVQAGRRAVAAASDKDPRAAGRWSLLGGALRLLAERTGDTSLLREAVEAHRYAVTATPERDPAFPSYVINLANALRALAERAGKDSMLDEAVQAGRRAVEAVSDNDLRKAALLANLGTVLLSLSKRTGEDSALREAVEACRRAVALTPADHVHRAAYLSNLANALRALFEHTADASVLGQAVDAARQAAEATPEGTFRKAVMLSNLAAVLQRVFEWTGDTSALEEATDAIRRAAGMTGSDDAARAVFLGNLAASLQTLAERTGGSQVLADALEASRAALVAAPADHPYRSRYLSNLGRVLQVMSEQTGDAALLAEAVDARRRAVESTPAGHIERAAFLTDLANTLRAQFGQTGNTSLLQEAVEVSRQAVDVTPEDYADRASRLVNLATTLRMLAEQTADSAFVEEAGQLYDEAARLPTAAAHVRLSAGYWAAATDLDLGDAEAALRTAEDMAALLPQAAERGLSRDDREYRLGTAAGLPVLAAAASVAAGQYGRGVELLEQTRGILLTEGMEDRMDAAVLRRVAPDLAFEYDALRREFASLERASEEGVIPIPTISATDTSSIIRIARTGALAEARRDLAMRWDDLLIRIRHQPGLQDFLRPPPVGELRPNAADGPIVLIYTSRWNSGALILTTDGPDPAQYVPLPAMTEDNTYAQINRLLQARRTEADTSTPAAQRIEAQDDIHQVLAWMWDAITAPILSALGLEDTPEPGQPWPRIWWCPVGGLAFLPLHAAGYHLDRRLPGQTARTVMDRAVSSYTTTARTMSYTRSRQQGNPARLSPSMLIVAVPDLPGAPPLPGVSHEADLLQQLIPDTQRLDGPAATHDAVVTALDSHQIAHFACHGISDWQHTAGSRLLLHDDAEQPLTAAVISRQRLTDAGLAYLSACSTAMPRPATTDEPAHIAAAFQLAGYPQIIATLWPVSDTAAVRIASEFYTYLTGSGRQPTDLRGSAAALHHAVRFLRDKYPNLPSAWAAYIHLGT